MLRRALRRRLDAAFADPEGAPALVRRLLGENARAYAGRYALAFLFMALTAAATAASAWIMRDVVNAIFLDRRAELVAPIGLAVIAIFAVKGAATYAQSVIMARIGAGIVARVQRRVVDNLLAQGMDFYDRAVAGDLTTRLSHNAEAARQVLDKLVTGAGRDLLTVLALIGVMVAQDPVMAGAALVVGPPMALGVAALVRRVKKLARKQFYSLARIVSAMNETVRGARAIQAFGLEARMRERLFAAVEEVERRRVGVAKVNALTSPLTETLGGVAIALVIFYAGWSVIGRGADPGAFFSFVAAFLLAYEPAKRLAKLNVQVQAALVGVRLLYEMLDRRPTLLERPDAAPLRVTEGRVRLEDVRFGYGDAPALEGLTLEARPGETTALVGPSGSGKSTVFSLIMRFYDPQAGRVTVDGQDVRDVTLASLRAQVGLVAQDSFLFTGTVRDNIRLGRLDASEAELEAAARDANVLEFAGRLPGGLDAEIGEGGAALSGGQRQRVAIARAMLRDAPILLLDEATSALDAEAEAAVQEALARLMRGRTVLVVAHRLATVQGADRIHAMRDGRAIESGTHGELMARGGLYRRLRDLQFQDAPASGAA
jgi:ATP-binding cassette subfamily B protein